MTHTDVPMYYLSHGQFNEAMLWVFTTYIGYGIIYILLGVAILATTYRKTRSAAISGFILALFLSLVNFTLPVEVQMYFTILVAVLFFMVIYRVLR